MSSRVHNWRFLYLLLGLGVIVVDRLTKRWALTIDSLDVTSWLSFDLVLNRGVSWGMLSSHYDGWFMLVTAMTILITLLVAVHGYLLLQQHKCIAGHVLIVAGSVSNIADRFMYGGVIDFIHLHYKGWSWPVFNCADISIVAGSLLLFYFVVREESN